MQVPSDWTTRKRHRTNRSRGETSRKKSRWVHEQAEPTSLEDMCNGICESILDSKQQQLDQAMNLDTILSNVPYQKILENLFGGTPATQCHVPVITKAYEESFMRECVYQGERKCVMGTECECRFVDRENPFVGVELRLPGPLPATPQMCALCSRKHTQKMYYDMLYRPPAIHTGVIQRYGVLCSVENEYNPNYVLMMPPHGPVHCMPFPSPVHGRNNYTVQVRSAVRYVVQRAEVGFRLPSLKTTSDA